MAEQATPTNITVEKIIPRGKYSTVKDGANYYSVWDQLILDRLAEGQSYTVMVTSKDSIDKNTGETKTFHNIVGITAPEFLDLEAELEAVMPGTKAANKPAPTAVKSISTAPLDFMIDVRKTALLCATRLLAADKITQKSINVVLKEYERYIVNGNAVEQKNSTPPAEEIDINDFVV